MNLFFLNKKNIKIKAFTLLEVLASLTIVTMVILGPLTSAIDSSSYARQTKDVMISTYLAEEALELLRHQYTTIYLQCIHNEGMCTLALNPNLAGETDGDKAWRIFKERLDGVGLDGGVSCFDGCAYDFFDMKDISTTTPNIYSLTGDKCTTLSLVTAVGIGATTKNYYVCTGVSSHHAGGFSSKKSQYSRNVIIESSPTFNEPTAPSGGSNIGIYNDDLVMTSSVSYRRSNGTLRTIKVIDFLHKRS